MASPRTRSILKDLKLKDDNNVCFECGAMNPQWVSVSYAMTLQQKYNSKTAALYRDKILTESQGKSWDINSSPAQNHTSFSSSTYENKPKSQSSSNEWTQFQSTSSSKNNAADRGYQNYSDNDNDSYGNSFSYHNNSNTDTSSRGSGGNKDDKYWGFGNTNYDPSEQKKLNNSDLVSSLSTGVSALGVTGGKWLNVAKDSVFKISKQAAEKSMELGKSVGEQAKDGTLINNVQTGVTSIASTVGKLSTKTWSDMQSLWAGKDYHNMSSNSEGSSLVHQKNTSSVLNDDYRQQQYNSDSGGGGGGYQNIYPSIPQQTPQQQVTNDRHDVSFESWLNADNASTKDINQVEPKQQQKKPITPKLQQQRSTPSPQPVSSSVNPPSASKTVSQKKPQKQTQNLINFDDETKWTNEDDGEWESIDTK
ncbi:unnamed protein product [Didymodactylos carnosus]|uniref:ADP-ribosylation factor GTPase-activating protein 1 n=1 Tax=Didymodactylos carnosus TaxID=1234261 RepID=A0A813ZEA0_9BILA|nr:unnamed protein product [Didymodactylos carnosus]CAF0927690.1 unnamed protein product [Didymodactylos carnosus]CAF3681099.1 unnamed protein product [Didymodactylos carnosus]CAF3704622.1 unnamed protein product [Didymodactylos carnosus]